MKVLLTNDDGIHAGGINALADIAKKDCELFVIAPRTEQSGISQAITFLRPMFPVPLKNGLDGFSLDGTPTDCVKLGLFELCPWKPDLVISGINGGLNAGVNTCYSGTVGGALAAATFEIPSIAASLEFHSPMDYKAAAEIVWPIIKQLAQIKLQPKTTLNINIPTAALSGGADTVVVPVETNPLGFQFDKGEDSKGRKYFWANNKPDPKPSPFETDCSALKKGQITVSAISYDLNATENHEALASSLEAVK